MRAARVLLSCSLLALALAACGRTERQRTPEPASAAPVAADRLAMFTPIPPAVPAASGAANEEMIALGRMLYYEPRLSKSQTISCNSCHDLAKYGVDGEVTSDGHAGKKGDRNSPTVYNAAAHFVQFWDGRAADVEEQAKGPVLNPVEMAMGGEAAVVAVLASIPEYVDRFARAFPGEAKPISYDNMARAIGAFERRLMTPSRWDALLAGDASALIAEEQVGLKTFLDAGCQACHYGALLGGTSYQRLGAVKAYPGNADPGRFKVTGNEADRAVFKVPSLRNIDKTAPYFHDGHVADLQDAVRQMGEYQLGKTLTDAEVQNVVAFLRVLTGKIDEGYIKPPELPKSTANTPKPVL